MGHRVVPTVLAIWNQRLLDGRTSMFRFLTLRLAPRDPHEPNRSATSLELMFDLATVVAVGAAAHGLAHEIQSGHVIAGVVKFLCSFFMTWLAWANYTWFASAYDDKSVVFRALSMVIMFGALALAGGLNSAYADEPIRTALAGFIIMRLGIVVFWLGAANGDREARPAALRYALAISAMQVYWTAVIVGFPPQGLLYLSLFALGAVGELAIPALAERNVATPWHHDHIVERYNLFNIIVIGECFLSIARIFTATERPDLKHFWLASLCSVIAFSMWGLYFDRKEQLLRRQLGSVLLWAYGHYVVFAAGAATAAGFSIFLAVSQQRANISTQGASLALGISIAFYLTSLWLVRDRANPSGVIQWVLLGAAALILVAATFAPYPLEAITAVLAVAALVRRNLHPYSKVTADMP
ncbi:low temperature requirement protein A [Bradyrhizobium sp. NBAIM14]|uniref:low temperature requirement protein A n=1 Tax=Bradyrhizobium sp. NBAIM14 TaxID=2793814 RepID=UPI001CD1A0EE|nr:low temperature requirement protein A [Bradyrhizobium sp. NBAIM14]MCA1500071.1 low temperature requirement protein A [Bradyrhizobium sp. NBAIM14]